MVIILTKNEKNPSTCFDVGLDLCGRFEKKQKVKFMCVAILRWPLWGKRKQGGVGGVGGKVKLKDELDIFSYKVLSRVTLRL